MTLDDFLEKLDGVTRAGNGYVAICPSHDDTSASLGVTEGDDERILLQCYAGCSAPEIVKAMGLSLTDLFPPREKNYAAPDTTYVYQDEQGNTLYEVLRFNMADGKKRFQQRHHDPEHPDAKADGWVWNMEGVRRVLYHLPEVIEAVKTGKRVYFVEGEKDADRIMEETGRCATTSLGGAGKWKDEYTHFFHGARVTVIQDKDEPGKRFAQKIIEELTGVAAEILLLQSKVGKDVSDMYDAGLAMETGLVKPRVAPRRGIVTMAELVEQGREYLTYREADLPGWELVNGLQGSTVRQGRLYTGGAYTGDGKTTIAMQGTRNIASRGVPCGYFSAEMSERDLRNRLIAHKGVPNRLLEKPWLLKQEPDYLALYNLALEEMAEWRLEIIYDTGLTADKIVKEAVAREYEFVVVDHIHRFGRRGRDVLEEEVMKLTNLALDMNIPVLVLAQLRKPPTGKGLDAYPRPQLHDFRETSSLGDEASIAFAVWRSRDESGISYKGDTSEFIVLKNRHTTTHNDQSGHIDMLNFNRTTQLYTPTGGANGQTGTEALRSPHSGGGTEQPPTIVDWED